MIGLLHRYAAMKDSGVRWLGAIPRSWDIVRSKRLFLPRTELARVDDIQLSATQAYGVIPQADYERAVGRKVTRILQHLEKRRHVEVDDFVISMRSFQGGLERAWASGCIRSSYVVLRSARPLVVGYYGYLFKSIGYVRALQSTASFIRDGQDLNFDNFCEVDLPWPPASEQSAIARFLIHADRKIRRYIRAKQKLIALLEEQKNAIIHRTVTRGLDASVRVKPSGVAWLGNVPAHWEVRQLRQCASIMGGMTPSMENRRFWDGAIPWVTPKDMKQPLIGDSILRVSQDAIQETSLRLIPPPAVLMVVRGMILARRVPVACTTATVTVNQDMKALVPFSGVEAEFLAAYLSAAQAAFVPLIDEAGHGTRRLPTERWRSLATVVPPLSEQLSVVRFLTNATGNVVGAIDRARDEVSLLREYRTRLIADVVTGKLDVRKAAARLPEEVDEPELIEAVDGEADADGPTNELDTTPEEAEV